jgi:hypothetical protein
LHIGKQDLFIPFALFTIRVLLASIRTEHWLHSERHPRSMPLSTHLPVCTVCLSCARINCSGAPVRWLGTAGICVYRVIWVTRDAYMAGHRVAHHCSLFEHLQLDSKCRSPSIDIDPNFSYHNTKSILRASDAKFHIVQKSVYKAAASTYTQQFRLQSIFVTVQACSRFMDVCNYQYKWLHHHHWVKGTAKNMYVV